LRKYITKRLSVKEIFIEIPQAKEENYSVIRFEILKKWQEHIGKCVGKSK
jgi:hypothetical protein